MSLKYSQKMFLITPSQLGRLNQAVNIRGNAQENLDTHMREILEDPGLDNYEKAKKYETLLQKYLTLNKQDLREKTGSAAPHSEPDPVLKEILSRLPQRHHQNVEYILNKLSEGGGGWRADGAFVFKGSPVIGSHILDLIRQLVSSLRTDNGMPGWDVFLSALASVNLPSSCVTNPQAKSEFNSVRLGVKNRSERKKNITLSPTWTFKDKEFSPGPSTTPIHTKRRKSKRNIHLKEFSPGQSTTPTQPKRRKSKRNIHPPKWLTFAS